MTATLRHSEDPDKARLRLGYIVPQYPGQTHIFFWRELNVLRQMGHHVSVFSTRPPPPGLISHDWSQQAMDETDYLGRVDVVQALSALLRLVPKGLPLWMLQEGRGFSKDALITLSAAARLVAQARALRLDHVHAHSCARSALIAAFAHKMGGPTWSMTLHGPLQDYGPGQRFKWRNTGFASVITDRLYHEVQQELAGHLPERIVIRPMGVDTEVLKRTAPYEPVRHGTPIRVFACGRLNRVKGHQDLMTAIRQLLDAGVDVRLEIAGEDDDGGHGYRKELEAHRKTLRLQDHVKLLGAIDANAVRDKLLKAHVFVLASWSEPLGVAYMEAMSCGVPTIGTAAGGVGELITDGQTGVLVPPKDPAALAGAIRRIAADPELALRLGQAGRAHVVANFASSLGAEMLVNEIRRLKSA